MYVHTESCLDKFDYIFNSAGQAPEVVTYLKDIHSADGEQARLECKIVGQPRPNVTWYHDEQMVYQSEEFKLFYDEDNLCSLVIMDVYPEDAGKYTVVAKNEFGTAMSSCELIVAGMCFFHVCISTKMT